MAESKVKGEVFQKVLDQVVIKWGKDGLNIINANQKNYKTEQWYPFTELCDLFSKIKSSLGNNNPLTIYQLGFNTIKKDSRWQEIFQNQNPNEALLGTKHQDDQYNVGKHVCTLIGPKHIKVELTGFDCEPVWYEFYRGRLQGVLELTGRTGVVHLLPPGEDKGSRTYDIKWG